MAELTFRPLRVDDRDAFLACFNEGFGLSQGRPYFDWQYRDDPAGTLLGEGAFDGDKLVGIYVVAPVRMQLGDVERVASQSMDTVVLESARGQGLFKKLGQRTYAALASEHGNALTYGFPNGNSVHGFTKYLGWQLQDPVPFVVRVLRTSFVTRRLGLGALPGVPVPTLPLGLILRSGCAVREVTAFPDDTDSVWEGFRGTFRVGVVRDLRYLRWRFEQRPDTAYRIFEARRPDGALEGLAVLRLTDKHGGRIGYVMELITRRRHLRVGSQLLRELARAARRDGAEILIGWSLPHHVGRRAFTAQGFVDLPKRFWPVELHFGHVAHDPGLAGLLADRAAWYLSYADSDTV